MKIAPSILSADFSRLYEEVNTVEKAGADFLHIDVMDGHFVPNITIGPMVVKPLRNKSNLVFDVHLMIENPDQYIPEFVKNGADIISVHAEACTHLHRTIQLIKSLGCKASVALNPSTPLNVLEYVLSDLDMVVLMSVNPGFGGQKFITSTIKKITQLKDIILRNNLNTEIEIDGGVNLDNLSLIINAGAEIIVAGSAIFNSKNIENTIKNFRSIGDVK